MSAEDRIRKLLERRAQEAWGASEQAAELTRKAARVAWVRETMEALRAAQRNADQAWERLVAAFPDDVDDDELEDLPPPAEQAQVDAIHAEINAVIDHDRWPRHLYWSL